MSGSFKEQRGKPFLQDRAAAFFRNFMRRYDRLIYSAAAVMTAAAVLLLFGMMTRPQQEIHRTKSSGKTSAEMFDYRIYPPENQRNILWFLKIQDPSLFTRGDHPDSYNALWKRTPAGSLVKTPQTDIPEFARKEPEKAGLLKNPQPEKDLLLEFVPEPAAAPEVVPQASPRAYDGNGKRLMQLQFERTERKVSAPTRLMIRKQGSAGMPVVLESCGDPALDEAAVQQVAGSLARLKDVREITVYWNVPEGL